ncbi:hypothetical protein ILUMI_03173 [Ignelater luminosus]|uniref:CUB domain-containing protein n=1 Tax=Ignelater luminosus TaxID=2038154 RepID=A0A8K0DF25_IGNLU|nr:hypothetical protein ILUMI_03173 [Ignelater luminosus]
MSLYIRTQIFCVLITLLSLPYNAIAQEVATPKLKTVFLQNDDEHTWSSLNYPEAYPAGASEDLLVTADKGYSIVVIVESVDLDGFNGDFLTIKAGTSLEDDGDGKVFTFSVKSELKYAVHANSVFFSFKVDGENPNGRKGFKLHYQRVGEAITTTEAPSTTEAATWPTPSGSESMHYIGFIHGKNKNDFLNPKTLANLKMALSEMAKKYCEHNDLVLTEAITGKKCRDQLLS